MPTFSTMHLPPPMDGTEFENIALDALRIRWKSPSLAKHGRKGQAQWGVDIFGPDNLGRNVGVQCKATASLTMKVISSEVEKADDFEPRLASFYIATTLPTDAQLQKEVRVFSDARESEGKFPVGIIFWESIVGDLAKDPLALQLHYPQLAPVTQDANELGARLVSALDLGMVGTNLKYRMELLFGEWGLLSNEDPHSFSRVTLRLESCGAILFQEPTRTEFIRLTRDLLAGALRVYLRQSKPNEGWDDVNALATKIEAHVEALENRLPRLERAAYICGRNLGWWDQLESDEANVRKIPPSLVSNMVAAVGALGLSAEIVKLIQGKAVEFETSKSIMIAHIPSVLYGAIRSAIQALDLKSGGGGAVS